MDNNINNYLKKKRIDRGYAQQELSRLSGVSVSHISRIEGNKRKPTHKVLQKLAFALQVEYLDLLKKANYLENGEDPNLVNLKEILYVYNIEYSGKCISDDLKSKIIKFVEKELTA